ncbi:MAG: hypothetical protein LC642_08635 [Verrucomicrobiaceae bacterium]|nr:hypothetical protein [Verrucomicrobiaceae bacterium]
MNLKALAFLTVGLFALSQAFAGDKACCPHGKTAGAKMNCSATFAKLDLTADQKAQMEKLAADCEKGGCNEQTMAKMEQGARKVLNNEQFAQWKAACDAGHHHGEKKTTS